MNAASDPNTILIVDDLPDNLRVLVDCLEEHGFDIIVARSGEEGVTRAEVAQPSLILLDVVMPGINGFETCRRLKASKSTIDIPVIFMTAHDNINDKVAGFDAGGVDYITTKPIQVAELIARVKTHIALSTMQKQMALQNQELLQINQELANTLHTLNVAHAELARSEKLAALGSVGAGIAHELNTPIGNSLLVASTLLEQTRTVADGYAGGLKRSVFEGFIRDAEQAGDILVRNLHRAGNLIASFKQVAVDQTSSRRRSFLLAETVSEIMLTLWPTLKKTSYTVEQNIPSGILIDSYPGPLGQVLINLVNNALLHGFEGRNTGTVSISAQRRNEGRVEILVKDNGVGIASADMAHIFDPFFTTKPGDGGSGLGLNIVQGIVRETLGGEIYASSEVGGGTSFVLDIPTIAPQSAQE